MPRRVDDTPLKFPRSGTVWPHLGIAVLTLTLLAASPGSNPMTFGSWEPFTFLTDDTSFGTPEKLALFFCLIVSVAALLYAYVLGKRIFAADQGTSRMQEIAQAVREGSNAYLRRQFRTVGVMLVFLTAGIIATKWPWSPEPDADVDELKVLAISRGVAFLIGAFFSAAVGFFGMRLATTGNLRVAAAARRSFTEAMKLGYQTGTVTGMLTTGLGLLGGCLIVLVIGEKAYETLLGFAFGGSLLALFMRVGGGIYTKAADVGADLVGKVEAEIPEDDPRNAATIADNVGDNVGDCAGMAADVFESYSVTMVAAVILGYAAFGPKAMLLPLLMQAVGILSSFFSTSLVGRGQQDASASGAMKAINRSFWTGAAITLVGFFAVNALYVRVTPEYLIGQALERGLAKNPVVQNVLFQQLPDFPKDSVLKQYDHWKKLPEETQTKMAGYELASGKTIADFAREYVPVKDGIDWRPAVCCLIGVLLTLALMRCTEYWTSTEYGPVKSITLSSRTGHATNIIQGIAVGYESTVWSVMIIAGAIFAGVQVYEDTHSPIFIAFGVSLCGIGMLALTGDTLSMDVFGPVSDNASGIGEMAYNKNSQNQDLQPGQTDYMSPAENKAARQILTDLDATGNTTKAITKGIAIGSAVIAAVSLFASFIAVLVKGNEEEINQLTATDFDSKNSFLSVARTDVFIGMLLGGAVPFLFSSMTIRAVGRAAYLIVNECRRQFKDKEILEGTKRPDYGRVVDICTATAQKELVGPGLLAIFAPILVGFLFGPFALGGFLAGMIVVGQLLAVFMATSGGAWDNSKKMIEDHKRSATTGKKSEMHKASVTGDTVGDPLKDTAGPAINPLIKVMNMVSLLVLPLVTIYNLKEGHGDALVGWGVVAFSLIAISWSWWQSKRDTEELRQEQKQFDEELRQAEKNSQAE